MSPPNPHSPAFPYLLETDNNPPPCVVKRRRLGNVFRRARREDCADGRFEDVRRRDVDAEMKILMKGNSAVKEEAKFFDGG